MPFSNRVPSWNTDLKARQRYQLVNLLAKHCSLMVNGEGAREDLHENLGASQLNGWTPGPKTRQDDHTCPRNLGWIVTTFATVNPWKFNIAPEILPSRKVVFQSSFFQWLCSTSGVYFFPEGNLKRIFGTKPTPPTKMSDNAWNRRFVGKSCLVNQTTFCDFTEKSQR